MTWRHKTCWSKPPRRNTRSLVRRSARSWLAGTVLRNFYHWSLVGQMLRVSRHRSAPTNLIDLRHSLHREALFLINNRLTPHLLKSSYDSVFEISACEYCSFAHLPPSCGIFFSSFAIPSFSHAADLVYSTKSRHTIHRSMTQIRFSYAKQPQDFFVHIADPARRGIRNHSRPAIQVVTQNGLAA